MVLGLNLSSFFKLPAGFNSSLDEELHILWNHENSSEEDNYEQRKAGLLKAAE